jgi:hypothetical protein
VVSHGKHLLGYIEGDFFFTHTNDVGSLATFEKPIGLPEKERARTRSHRGERAAARSCFQRRIFNVGEGDPYKKIEI